MDKQISWVYVDFLNDEYEDDEDENDDDSYSESEPEHRIKIPVKNLVNTPFGLMNYVDNFSPVKNTQFEIAHTNFNVSKAVIESVAKCDGVEFLFPNGRYRFIVGFGVMFDPEEVKRNIENVLGVVSEQQRESEDLPLEINDCISKIQKLGSECEYWCGYVFPNGQFKFYKAENEKDFNVLKLNISEMSTMSLGIPLFSDIHGEIH